MQSILRFFFLILILLSFVSTTRWIGDELSKLLCFFGFCFCMSGFGKGDLLSLPVGENMSKESNFVSSGRGTSWINGLAFSRSSGKVLLYFSACIMFPALLKTTNGAGRIVLSLSDIVDRFLFRLDEFVDILLLFKGNEMVLRFVTVDFSACILSWKKLYNHKVRGSPL